MQEKLQNEVKAEGLATSAKMALPMGLLALPAIGLVVVGPLFTWEPNYYSKKKGGVKMDEIKTLLRDERGQDILEYVIIIAFAVTLIGVVAALYSVLSTKLQDATGAIGGIAP